MLSVWILLVVPAVAIAWLALLIEGRLPLFLHRFLGAFLRYQVQVTAWFGLLSARYPDPLHTLEHPFRIELVERSPQPRLVTVFRLPLARSKLGRTTGGLQELGMFCLRYQLETQAYVTLLTAAYPRLEPSNVTTARE